jgi:hypothetical protein
MKRGKYVSGDERRRLLVTTKKNKKGRIVEEGSPSAA